MTKHEMYPTSEVIKEKKKTFHQHIKKSEPQMGVGLGEWVEKEIGLRSTNWREEKKVA